MDKIKQLRNRWKKQGIDLLVESTKYGIYIDRLVIPEPRRGQGIGSAAMQTICELADNQKKLIYIYPSDICGMSMNVINKFYKKFGFVYNYSKRLKYMGYNYMYREPQ